MKKLSKILLTLAFSVLGLFFLFVALFFAFTSGVKLDSALLEKNGSVAVLDKDGEEIEGVFSVSSYSNFSLSELDEKVKYAFVDCEDKRFYSHHGFDYKRMAKALLVNLRSRSFKEGASTISQQLIKNTHLTQNKTIERKLKELRLTKQLEQKYTKDEILEMYLSTIYFGHNCFGLPSAALFYFGKSPDELTLSDGAVLAGLIRSPNGYSPFKNPEGCKKRKAVVLSAMYKQKHITKEEYDLALAEDLPTQRHDDSCGDFLYRVFDEFSSVVNLNPFAYTGKIVIRTAYDKNLQKVLASQDGYGYDKVYAVLDNSSALFCAYRSSIGAKPRLPASVIKPLLVYAPALEEGEITPATMIADTETDFSGYCPKNFSDTYSGYRSVRDCLSESLNVPAVKILSSFGIEKATRYLAKMSLPVEEEDKTLALALGGMKKGYPLTDILSAYSTFANDGNYLKGSFIESVTVNGKTVYRKSYRKTKVFRDDTAYLIDDMLKTCAKTGTAKKLRSFSFDLSAKTGTGGTQLGNTDAYTVAYTSEHTVGVWLGSADNTPSPIVGGGYPANVAYEILSTLYKDTPPKNFVMPSSVKELSIDKIEYSSSQDILLSDPLSPKEYLLCELFSVYHMPRKQSTRFSVPRIFYPEFSFVNGCPCITLDSLPDYYDYTIERTSEKKTYVVYRGKGTGNFIDDTVKDGETYTYTLIPHFASQTGEKLIFPTVTTTRKQSHEKITGEEWWDK